MLIKLNLLLVYAEYTYIDTLTIYAHTCCLNLKERERISSKEQQSDLQNGELTLDRTKLPALTPVALWQCKRATKRYAWAYLYQCILFLFYSKNKYIIENTD